MHLYECRFCKKHGVEMYSWHYLTPDKRGGADYCHCILCGKNYILMENTCELNGFAVLTNEPWGEFLRRYLYESARDFGKAISIRERKEKQELKKTEGKT